MLVAEALVLASEGGVAAVTLREAARRLGISHSAAYHHFVDRRAIIAAAATEGMSELAAALEEAERESAADPADPAHPAERVCRLAAAYVGFALRQPAAFRLMFAPDVAAKSDLPELREASDRASAPLLRALLIWHGSHRGQREELRELAVSLWSLVHGLSELALNAQLDEGELHVGSPRDVETYQRLAWRAAARILGEPDRRFERVSSRE